MIGGGDLNKSPPQEKMSDTEDETEHEECDCCEVRFSIEDEDAYQYIKGKQPIYVCVKCYKANKEHYDEIEAEYKSDE